MYQKICVKCGVVFDLPTPDNRVLYCSNCAKKRRRTKAEHPLVKCIVCGRTFTRKNSLHKFDRQKCKDKFHSKNFRNKIRFKSRFCKFCGKPFGTYDNEEFCSDKCEGSYGK